MIMRYYKSFILFGMFAWTFTSCNTDDLERNIDALTDRVVNMEAQIQRLNDNMNLIRVMLDGNQTITEWSENNGTYTLKLSNGETLTLTPGNEDQKNYPSIEIGSNGNWVIGGVETDWRAEAQNGNDATITPQFKIEANAADGGKKYWYVSYDEGKTWEVLENGLAEGTNENKNPITKAEVKGDAFEVTFDGKLYQIPIVKGLECAINLPKNEAWAVAAGQPASFKVKVNLAEGDLVRVNAPVEWKASVAAYKAGDKEVTVNVTAPATPSECVISVEVTHGVNAAIDKVTAKVASDSYWADYQAGLDIKIGDVVINKYDFPGAMLLKNNESVPAKGVCFIAKDATVKIEKVEGISDLILIAETKDNNFSSKVRTIDFIALGHEADGVGFLCKGISIAPESTTKGYWFNLGGKPLSRLYFEDCKIELLADKMFSYFANATSGIDHILVKSSYISVPQPPKATKAINFINCNQGSYENITLQNNVFYCPDADKSALLVPIMKGPKAEFEADAMIQVEHNTLINVLLNQGGNSGMIRVPYREGWTVKNNLIWFDKEETSASPIASILQDLEAGSSFNEADFANNKIFTAVKGSKLEWHVFRTAPKDVNNFNNDLTVETTSPFVDGTLVDTEGKYELKPEYKGKVGADIK